MLKVTTKWCSGNQTILECISKGQSSIINLITNCCLLSKLSWKMPGLNPLRNAWTDINIQASIFTHFDVCFYRAIVGVLLFGAAMQFKRQEISTTCWKRMKEKSREKTLPSSEHQVEMLNDSFFSLRIVHKNAKGLEWISSILFSSSNENATAWAKMLSVKEWQQQKRT